MGQVCADTPLHFFKVTEYESTRRPAQDKKSARISLGLSPCSSHTPKQRDACQPSPPPIPAAAPAPIRLWSSPILPPHRPRSMYFRLTPHPLLLSTNSPTTGTRRAYSTTAKHTRFQVFSIAESRSTPPARESRLNPHATSGLQHISHPQPQHQKGYTRIKLIRTHLAQHR